MVSAKNAADEIKENELTSKPEHRKIIFNR